MPTKFALLVGAAAASMVISQGACAQTAGASSPVDAAPPADTNAGAESDGGLKDIVVTAQRRSESSQRVGIAIDVVSNDAIVSAGVTGADDLTTLVPALQVTNGGGANTTFYLRGVGAFTNSYADPAIAFNYDGVYIGRPASTAGMFYDLERVEVLKGPQGTLYGRNATGGAINVIPTRPILGQTSGYASFSYGNYNAVQAEGAINLPFTDKAAIRIAGTYLNRDGYQSDGASDDDGYALRGQLLVKPTDNLSIRLGVDYFHAGGVGGGANYLARALYSPVTGATTFQPSGLGPSAGMNDPRSGAFLQGTFAAISGRTLLPLQRSGSLDNDTWGVSGEINWSNSLGTLTVVPSYRRLTQKSVANATGFLVRTDELDEQNSLEVRFASDASRPLSWLIGGFYYREDIDSDFSVQQQVLASFQRYRQATTSYAAFGRLTFKVTDTFRLIGGARYTSDKKEFAGTANVLLDICTDPTHVCPAAPLLPYSVSADDAIGQLGLLQVAPGTYIRPGDPGAAATIFLRGVTPITQSRKDGRFTYRVGAEWDWRPASLLYASYETGFRSGGFAFSLFNPTFGPEQIRAFTLGSKNRFFDNKLQLNLELFYWKYRDQQVSHQGNDPNVGQTFFTENIGQSTNKGFEIEALLAPFKGTRLSADVQYLDAKYTSFVYNIPAFAAGNPMPVPAVGCAVTRPGVITPASVYTIDCSGKQAYRSPRWTINLDLQQMLNLGAVDLVATVGTHYQSSNYTGFEFLDLQRTPAYWTSAASIKVKSPNDAWSLTAFVNNIENKRYGSFAFYNDANAALAQISTAPRTYGIRAGVRF